MASAFVTAAPRILRTHNATRPRASPRFRRTPVAAARDDRRSKRVPPSDFADPAVALPNGEDAFATDVPLTDAHAPPAAAVEADVAAPPADASAALEPPATSEPLATTETLAMTEPLATTESPATIEPPATAETLVQSAAEHVGAPAAGTSEAEVAAVGVEPELASVETAEANAGSGGPSSAESGIEASKPATDGGEALAEPSSEPSSEEGAKKGGVTGVKMSAEDIEKAREKKEAAAEKARKEKEASAERRQKIFQRAQSAVQLAGDKTGVVQLGARARASLEARIDGILSNATDATDATNATNAKDAKDAKDKRDGKLARTAATAFRSLSSALYAQWDSRAVPLLREKVLPDEAKEVGTRALAAATLGLLVGIVLLPGLFGGGGGNEQRAKKTLDTDTAALQRKLGSADRAAQRLAEKRSRTDAKLFPETSSIPEGLQAQDSARIAEAGKRAPAPTPAPPRGEAPPAAPSAPAMVEAPKEEARVADVTTDAVLSAVRKSVGGRASLLSGATFDSLALEPTVILEARADFARLPLDEQRVLTLAALKSARALGYDSITIVEADSGIEVAHAGVGVVLGDEAPTLRSQLKAMRTRSDRLAAENAEATSQVDALTARFAEERALYAERAKASQATLDVALAEKASLAAELADAEREIAAVPDREALEQRATLAEARAEEMSAAVETLSRQVTVARDAQGSAISSADAARLEAAASQAALVEASRAADARIEASRGESATQSAQLVREAEQRAAGAISALERERDDALGAAAAERARGEKAVSDLTQQFEKERLALRTAADKAGLAAEKTLASEVARLQKETADVRAQADSAASDAARERDIAEKNAEKSYAQRMDDIKRDAQQRLDDAMKDTDAQLRALRDETRSAVESADRRTRDVEKEAKTDKERLAKELKSSTRERDDLRRTVERLRAKQSGKAPASTDAASQE